MALQADSFTLQADMSQVDKNLVIEKPNEITEHDAEKQDPRVEDSVS